MVNKVVLIGRVGGEVTVKSVGDTQVAEFSLATNEKYKNKNGEQVENTEWHNCVFWRGLAGVVEKHVKKGDLLYLEGKIQTQTWEKDGEKKYKTIIQVSEMKMLGSKGGNSAVSEGIPQSNSTNESDALPF